MDKVIVLIFLVMIVMILMCHLKTLQASLSIKCNVTWVRNLSLELIVAAIHCVLARVLMQISLFNHQLIILCLVRKSKGSTFNILCLHGIYHLHYCTSQHKEFCFFCCKACRLKLINGNKRQKDTFVSAGLNNWKKSIARIWAELDAYRITFQT